MSKSGQWTFGAMCIKPYHINQLTCVEHDSLQQASSQCESLKTQVKTLENDNQQLRDTVTRITEESDMSHFKCKLMVEMVSIASCLQTLM